MYFSSIANDMMIKIGDFGHAKGDYYADYYSAPKKPIQPNGTENPESLAIIYEDLEEKNPLRWLAPESMIEGKFSTRSDVVNFYRFNQYVNQ